MTIDTNRLASVSLTDLQGSDLIRLWSQKYGGNTRLTLAVLLDYIAANEAATGYAASLTAQYEAPTATGFSVSVSQVNTWLVLTPSDDYAAGTIVLPEGSQGAEVLVNCTKAVTALTITPATGDLVIGGPSSLAANGFFRLRYDATLSRWYRVG